MINKTPLNPAQVSLARNWLGINCEPYTWNRSMRILWFWQPHYGQIVKNRTKLTNEQIKQLDQLS